MFFYIASWHIEAAFIGGEFTPTFPDSFYHASRILHSIEQGTLLQFDHRIHAPDGSWVPWPWGYDWLVARLTELISFVANIDLVQAMVYIPPAWGVVNIILLNSISRALGLAFPYRLIIVASFIFLPLNQQLHLIGRVDHHYMELSMILSVALAAIAWFKNPGSRTFAIGLGIFLGLSTAIHNGLFILQLPVIATLAISWLIGRKLPGSTFYFSLALFIATLLVLLPSESFRQGFFEYYYHSWFHLYVASCTSLVAYIMCRYKCSRFSVGFIGVLSIVMVLPLLGLIVSGYGFISGEWRFLEYMSETRSLIAFDSDRRIDVQEAALTYSGFIILMPLVAMYIFYIAFKNPEQHRIYIMFYFIMAMLMMFGQTRFHYYATFIPPIALASLFQNTDLGRLHNNKRFMVFVLLALISYWGASGELFRKQPSSPVFSSAYWSSKALNESCKNDPGIVLAEAKVGHYLRYFTECSVIANSFIMAPDNFMALEKESKLMNITPDKLHSDHRDIKYVYLMRNDNIYRDYSPEHVRHLNPKLNHDLLLSDSIPDTYRLLYEVKSRIRGNEIVFSRVFKLVR